MSEWQLKNFAHQLESAVSDGISVYRDLLAKGSESGLNSILASSFRMIFLSGVLFGEANRTKPDVTTLSQLNIAARIDGGLKEPGDLNTR